MPYMFFVHELERIVGRQTTLNGNDWRCHYVSYGGIVGIAPFQDNAVHEIPLAENSCKAIIVDYGNGANVFVMHCAHRFHDAGPRTDYHQRRPSNPQETH